MAGSPQSGSFEEQISPWVVGFAAFAGILMIMVGIFWVLEGIAALAKDDFYVLGREYVFEIDVTAWGWVHLIGGAIMAVAGVYVLTGTLWARIIGIVLALASAMANFMFVPYYPLWSILIISLNIVIIWALVSYGKKEAGAITIQ